MKSYTGEQLIAEGYKPAPAEYFTGKAYLKSFVQPDDNTNCIISDVLFEPGTRNNWHTHGSNQILMIKEGTCYYQEEGKPVQKIEAGGVINILPGVKHWHGASPDTAMIHTAIGINTEKGIVNWLEPVTDEQYKTEV
ncbi:cupin domain-containing protein [Mucilaginibacter sp. Bleaf8]|uniref:cupin domain-containing protein n=1 Tax=Mucilaginibacter sp. Bleaf8 TaxID=2834430 RepID=UPI001BCB7508|nr:cupin domain-containing protein [Mucilaginibacter sp. Bleaf8]MBS7566709.1 cupin domain-containing protein [Mucilaginibacter sp. Bleaf8]